MPNWCNNKMTISHDDPEMIKKAQDAWNSGNFLATMIPDPDYSITPVAQTFPEISAKFAKTEEEKAEIMANKPTIRPDSWWDWRVQNWGTKWDIGFDADLNNKAEVFNKSFDVFFDSAWSPPISAYEKLEEMGYKIYALYFESGCAFCGIYGNGYDECYNIEDFSEEWVDEHIPSEINEAFGISDMGEYL